MRRQAIALTAVVAATVGGAISSCGADPISVVSILLITNTWAEVGDLNHEFDLDATPPSSVATDHGTFVGVETTSSGQDFDLTGSWSDGVVQFVVERPNGQVATYSGSFPNDPDTLRLNSPEEGPLVIFRDR